jgi:glycosyltransferase involved in cell wall biosynthesis
MNRSRVLIVHNAYQHKGGEDAVVESEAGLLAANGHAVERLTRHNDEIRTMPRVSLAMESCWSGKSMRRIQNVIDAFKPDVIHAHNTFPLISPSIYWAAERAAIPVVQTLHNFRLLCPQAMFLRQGEVCEDCLGRVPWRGAWHACYRDSRAQSAVVAGMLTLHRALGTYRTKVSRFIALNEFCRRKFVEGGLPAERIVVKPNFVDFPMPHAVRREGFLFVGRLSAEKGLKVLASAARQLSADSVRVAGAGPESNLLEGIPAIDALGSLSADAVRAEMSRAIALLLPSLWYENFPRTVVEAFGCGLPVIASRIGALADLVEEGVTGLQFEPGNAQDLAGKMRWAQAHPEQMATMGRNARARYEERFTPERNYQQLTAIYRDVIEEASGRRAPRAHEGGRQADR